MATSRAADVAALDQGCRSGCRIARVTPSWRRPRTNVVLPAPRSPLSPTHYGAPGAGSNDAAKSAASRAVSDSERDSNTSPGRRPAAPPHCRLTQVRISCDLAGEHAALAIARLPRRRPGMHQHRQPGPRARGSPTCAAMPATAPVSTSPMPRDAMPGLLVRRSRRCACPGQPVASPSARRCLHSAPRGIESAEAIGPDRRGVGAEQARRPPGCGVSTQLAVPANPARCQQVQRVGVDDDRLVGGEHTGDTPASPRCCAGVPGPTATTSVACRALRPTAHRPGRTISSGRPPVTRAAASGGCEHGDQAGADPQRGLACQPRGARHAGAAADHQHATEGPLCAARGRRGSAAPRSSRMRCRRGTSETAGRTTSRSSKNTAPQYSGRRRRWQAGLQADERMVASARTATPEAGQCRPTARRGCRARTPDAHSG